MTTKKRKREEEHDSAVRNVHSADEDAPKKKARADTDRDTKKEHDTAVPIEVDNEREKPDQKAEADGETQPSKLCKGRCGKHKPVKDFSPRQTTCRPCQNANQREKPKMRVATKTCSVCNKLQTTENFHKRSQSKDGLAGHCKPCAIAKTMKKYRATVQLLEQAKANQGFKCGAFQHAADCPVVCLSREMQFAHDSREHKYKTKNGNSRGIGNVSTNIAKKELLKGRYVFFMCHALQTSEEEKKAATTKVASPGLIRERARYAYGRAIVDAAKRAIGACQQCKRKLPKDDRLLRCFELDHRDPETKTNCIAHMVSKNTNDLRDEIAKCGTLCVCIEYVYKHPVQTCCAVHVTSRRRSKTMTIDQRKGHSQRQRPLTQRPKRMEALQLVLQRP
jgi:hypothetical protein